MCSSLVIIRYIKFKIKAYPSPGFPRFFTQLRSTSGGPLGPLQHDLFLGAEGLGSCGDTIQLMLYLLCLRVLIQEIFLVFEYLDDLLVQSRNLRVMVSVCQPGRPIEACAVSWWLNHKEVYERHSVSAKTSLNSPARFTYVYQNHLQSLVKLPLLGSVPRFLIEYSCAF